jgi:DNA primase
MNANELKNWLYENNKIGDLLEEIGCHSIRYHTGGYYTAGNPNGDNKQAISIYVPHLNVINYTRDLPTPSDIITLVEFNKGLNFFQAIKYICEFFGLDFYGEPYNNLPKAMQILKMLSSMKNGEGQEEDDTPVKPIPEIILSYYKSYVNDFFYQDGISYDVQQEFEIGYDEFTNRITLPIRDELGTLCGIKGRLFKKDLSEDDLKYLYIEPCPRQKILYGLYKTMPYIKEASKVYVGEAEKFVLQLWSYGYKNCVATSGERVSKIQIEKLVRLNAEIVLCMDKDVSREKIEHIANQFASGIPVYFMWDENNILGEKEAPSDNRSKWEYLVENCIYKIK